MAVKTYVTARMLKQRYLAGLNLYASLAHTPEILDEYFAALDSVFDELSNLDNDGLLAELPSGPAHSGFRRLT